MPLHRGPWAGKTERNKNKEQCLQSTPCHAPSIIQFAHTSLWSLIVFLFPASSGSSRRGILLDPTRGKEE